MNLSKIQEKRPGNKIAAVVVITTAMITAMTVAMITATIVAMIAAATMTTATAIKEEVEKQEKPQKKVQIKILEHQALNNIKKIVAKSEYHSDEISKTDDELANNEKRKKIQYPLDNNCNNH
ncbi:4724_t:CDS:2, partial [Dentiscutata heterogama]